MNTIQMEKRKQNLEELRMYVKNVDNDISMILQNLQWDQKHLLQGFKMAECSINKHHRIPETLKECHEKECLLRSLGYDTKKDVLLPDPVDPSSKMCIKFSVDDVLHIIEKASNMDSKFHKGACAGRELPLSQPRLQCTYTADERRALHDAALVAAPPTPAPALALAGEEGSSGQQGGTKTRLQLLAEQRDMKRRRAKYRVATKSKNYSQVLREVIHNQLEMYAEIQAEENNRVKAQETAKNHECTDLNETSSEQTCDTNIDYNIHSKKKLYDDDKQRGRTEHRHATQSKLNEKCVSRQTFDYSNVKPGPSTGESSRSSREHRKYNDKDKVFNKNNEKNDRHDYRNINFDKHSQHNDRNKSNDDFNARRDNRVSYEHCKRERDQYSKSDIDQYIKRVRDEYSQKDMNEYNQGDKNQYTKRYRNEFSKRDINQYSKRDKKEYSKRDIDQYSRRERNEYRPKDMDEYSKRDKDQHSKRDRSEFSKRDINQYSKRKRDDYSQKDMDEYSKRGKNEYNKRDIDNSEKDKDEYRRYYDYPSGSK